MTTSIKRLRKGFTLIELLTVIAIIGILAAIIIPTVGKVRETAKRAVDGQNVRQIVQACLIYAADNRDKLPSMNLDVNGIENIGSVSASTTVDRFAAALAQGGGLTDGNLWFSSGEVSKTFPSGISNVVDKTATTTKINPAFAGSSFYSFGVVAGLTVGMASTTPVVVTRGLQADGTWSSTEGVYGSDGGHIGFLAGNMVLYKNLTGNANKLVKSDGTGQTSNIMESIKKSSPATARQLLVKSDGSGSASGPATGN